MEKEEGEMNIRRGRKRDVGRRGDWGKMKKKKEKTWKQEKERKERKWMGKGKK